MRRLYLQIYVSFLGILVLFGLLHALIWHLATPSLENVTPFEGIGVMMADLLPGTDAPLEEQQAALDRLGQQLPLHLSLFGPGGERLAAVGPRLPAPDPRRRSGGWLRFRGRGPTAGFRLPDGRWLVARHPHKHGHALGSIALVLALLAGATALGAYPVVRRLTGRLERLKSQVDKLGAGELTARVDVEGRDEVASLARSFNRAAERIEHLVQGQRSALAGASHELRTPLTRLRMAIELIGRDDRPELRERINHDIEELDELIGELLLASRLDAIDHLEACENVDILALAAEEAARTEASVEGAPANVEGDPRLLRRLVRNLLDNAARHGGTDVAVSVAPLGPREAVLRVEDSGPGIPAEERERIFQPFYRLPGSASGEKGVGLGLALVRQIAHHHGGDVHCLPRENGGTRFEVTLRKPRL